MDVTRLSFIVVFVLVAGGLPLQAGVNVPGESDGGTLSTVVNGCHDGHEFGSFVLLNESGLTVVHHDRPEQPVLQFDPTCFVAATWEARHIRFNTGSFTFRRLPLERCHVATWSLHLQPDGFTVSGTLASRRSTLPYTFRVTAQDPQRLSFSLSIDNGRFNCLSFTFAAPREEHVYGFGEQYDGLDMQGRRVPIWVEEQGIGRGRQPITAMVNLFSPGSGGDWYTTYAPMPYFISSQGRAMLLDTTAYSVFDFRDGDTATISIWSQRMNGSLFVGETPRETLQTATASMGRMSPLPDWTQEGAIVHLHGGSGQIRRLVQRYRDAGVPLAGIWIEDWCGTRETAIGTRLWWNWVPDRTLYPDWEELVAELRQQGIRTLIYFNPYLVDAADKQGCTRNLYAEARDAGYLVQHQDGGSYLMDAGGFQAGILDLTNPAARRWIADVIAGQIDVGVAGWMADHAECLPPDAALHSGVDPMAYHNRFPVDWAAVNRGAAATSNASGCMFFSRSGYTGSPGEAMLFWTGDQMTTWDAHDGIKTVVPAMVSSGLSGITLNHPDIGGYFSSNYPFASYNRSRELLKRWIELAAFTPVFRTHETNRPEPNLQVHEDSDMLEFFGRFATVYAELAPYRAGLMETAQETGIPLIRHPMLHYPDDPAVYALEQEYMLGPDFLVRPVLDSGACSREVYLPAGGWTHLWSNETYQSDGSWVGIDAPLGEPPVFFRTGAAAGRRLQGALAARGLLDTTL